MKFIQSYKLDFKRTLVEVEIPDGATVLSIAATENNYVTNSLYLYALIDTENLQLVQKRFFKVASVGDFIDETNHTFIGSATIPETDNVVHVFEELRP